MSKREREDACFVCGHFHTEQCTICGHIMTPQEKKQAETVMPVAVIPGVLYMGSYDTASRSEILKAMGITHILNTVPNCPCLFKNTFTYMTSASNPPDFTECSDFIDNASKESHKVLIYCMTGVSRSPTMVMGYLMRHRNWRLAESYKWVKDKRQCVNISAEDATRLIQLEMRMFNGVCSVPNGLNALNSPAGNIFGIQSSPASASTATLSSPTPAHFGQGTSTPSFGGSGQAAWSFHGQGGGTSSTAAPLTAFSFGAHPPADNGLRTGDVPASPPAFQGEAAPGNGSVASPPGSMAMES
ncbi:MAG: hypothetical protein WDW38_008395 [Sanguina aurantia]